jgi:hypothetical protein
VAKQRIELAAEKIGEFTAAGERYRWKLVFEDSQWTSAGGMATVPKLIYQDGVKFMNQGGDAGPAAQPICEEARVLLEMAGVGIEHLGPPSGEGDGY